jgi:hypothetical protein
MLNPFEPNTIDNFKEETENKPPELPEFNINSGGAIPDSQPSPVPITPQVVQPQSTVSPEKRKFIISDLYWLKNLKPLYKQALGQNEINTLVISYNADFENLRLCLLNCDQSNPKIISLPSGSRINSVNIFSETCREIISFFESLNKENIASSFPATIHNCERIISLGNNSWTPNETAFVILNQQLIEIHTKQPNGTQLLFTLVGWQVKAFLECCRFMTNGNSWMLKTHASIHKE